MPVLVHVCCGPCSIAVLRDFAAEGGDPHGFFYNPNIHPLAEYMRRRQGAAQAAARLGVPLIFADTLPEEDQRLPEDACIPPRENPSSGAISARMPSSSARSGERRLPPVADPVPWLRVAVERGEDRCVFCLRTRIFKCAEQARARGFDAFSTTLLYSRRQRHDTIRALGREAGAETGAAFVYRDFRGLWEDGIRLSKDWGIYRQQYCGCIFSEYERYARAFGVLRAGE
ncbi:MAG: epoxyqueuosine reductase QueH [Desulfovibrio sp.]|jgi:predicted adenine nucleotide alpha hydrolase (AANH) superfamily ATPase|nr:epoxyqueuosine reductase QueH [Desulfovibrio sp.]